ncbi:MAG: FtsX-like permease family protein, partial [Zetaproteobacteria bacterium]
WDEIDPMARQWAEFADAYSWVMILIVVGLVVAQSTNALWMNLHGQLHELALMRALGAGRSRVFQVVLWQGVWMVALGTALGFGAGIIASLLAARTGIDLSSFAEALQYLYLEPVVRPILRAEDMEKILAAALAGAVLGTLWPARVASRVDPKSATQRGV